MLTQDTLERSQLFVELLDAKKQFIRPIAGTPLAAIVDACRVDNNFMPINEAGQYTPSLGDIAFMANATDEQLGMSRHDYAMDQVCAMAIQGVTAQVKTIRTVVGPAVKELAVKTLEHLKGFSASSLLGMEVVTVRAPLPFLNASLEKEARMTEGVPYDNPTLGMFLPNMAVSDIIKLMETGIGSLDADIREWAAGKGDSFFLKIWETLFMENNLGMQTNKVMTLRDFIDNREDGEEWSLAVFLLARRLWDSPPEGTNMELRGYEDKMLAFRHQAASNVVRAMEIYQGRLKGQTMVIERTKTCVKVLDILYRDWIDAGGSNEVLFGMLVTGEVLTRADEINAKSQDLLRAWQRHEMVVNMNEQAARQVKTKEIMRKIFLDQLYDPEHDADVSEDRRQAVVKLFDEEMARIGEAEFREMKDPYSLALRLLCRSRFVDTDAENYLTWYNQLATDNPNVDANEISAMCTLRYITKWFVDTMVDTGQAA